MNTEERNIGLVLSGGGARGAYQIGVWEALKEIDLPNRLFRIAGVSIGAINAASILQELGYKNPNYMLDMWHSTVPGDIFNAFPEHLNNLDWKDYLNLGLDSLKYFKVRIEPLISRLFEQTNEALIRSSNIDYALSAWNRSKFKTEDFYLKNISDGLLADYILASASFPAFGAHKIGNYYYLDGGIGNNLPLDLVMESPEVQFGIAIDVGSFMRYLPVQLRMEKKYKERCIIIRPSKSIPSPVNFSQSAVQQMLEIGYEDGKAQLEKIKEKLLD